MFIKTRDKYGVLRFLNSANISSIVKTDKGVTLVLLEFDGEINQSIGTIGSSIVLLEADQAESVWRFFDSNCQDLVVDSSNKTVYHYYVVFEIRSSHGHFEKTAAAVVAMDYLVDSKKRFEKLHQAVLKQCQVSDGKELIIINWQILEQEKIPF